MRRVGFTAAARSGVFYGLGRVRARWFLGARTVSDVEESFLLGGTDGSGTWARQWTRLASAWPVRRCTFLYLRRNLTVARDARDGGELVLPTPRGCGAVRLVSIGSARQQPAGVSRRSARLCARPFGILLCLSWFCGCVAVSVHFARLPHFFLPPSTCCVSVYQ